MSAKPATACIYTDGSYLETTGGAWHQEDSPFKAREILRMLSRHPEIQPRTVCEIGCGAGAILAELQEALPEHVTFDGFDISPQAHALSARFEGRRCRFILGDAFQEDSTYDLVMAVDVVEHVEDCFSFLRSARGKGRWKLYHIPLETHVTAGLRGVNGRLWDTLGHLHLFTMETALKTMERTGHRVIDWTLTGGMLVKPEKSWLTRLANMARLPLMKLSPKLTVRLIGGYSMLILTE